MLPSSAWLIIAGMDSVLFGRLMKKRIYNLREEMKSEDVESDSLNI